MTQTIHLTKSGQYYESPRRLPHGILRGDSESRTKIIHLTHSGNYSYTLDKVGQSLEVIGTFWLKGHDILNLHLSVIHAVPHTSAKISLKAVVEDEAQAHLHGLVIVKKGAQKTDSFLEERVLLLSSKSRATAIPNLEIEANDVKCSHAVTIGRVDDDQLFYLESRGLSKTQATHLIATGFLNSN